MYAVTWKSKVPMWGWWESPSRWVTPTPVMASSLTQSFTLLYSFCCSPKLHTAVLFRFRNMIIP